MTGDHIYKRIELVGSSTVSTDDAIRPAQPRTRRTAIPSAILTAPGRRGAKSYAASLPVLPETGYDPNGANATDSPIFPPATPAITATSR